MKPNNKKNDGDKIRYPFHDKTDQYLRTNIPILSENLLPGLYQICDAVIIGLSGSIAYAIYKSGDVDIPEQYAVAMAMTVALFIYLGRRTELYRVETIAEWPRRMNRLILVMATVFLVLTALAFSLRLSQQYSRIWAFSTFTSSTVILILYRGLVFYLLNKSGSIAQIRQSVAVIGAGPQAEQFLLQYRGSGRQWADIVGIFDDREKRMRSRWGDFQILGNLDDLVSYVRRGKVSAVVITIPWSADARLSKIVEDLEELPVNIYLGPDLAGYRYQRMLRTLVGGVTVFEIAAIPISDWSAILKAIEDKMLSALLLVIFSPLMLAIAAAIRIDSPGPVIFRQRRYGFNNEPFQIRKFRSMYQSGQTPQTVVQAKRNDPRVTRIGRILRRTSLDELPQLIDVFLGNMSLVGPRPHAVEHDEYYQTLIRGYNARQKVKPGITGWAQVNGLRGETQDLEQMRARVAHDIYYIENWSLWFDLKILLMTFFVGFYHKRAY